MQFIWTPTQEQHIWTAKRCLGRNFQDSLSKQLGVSEHNHLPRITWHNITCEIRNRTNDTLLFQDKPSLSDV